MYGSQFYLQITPRLSLPRKRSPDGATPLLIEVADIYTCSYYSFIDPGTMKG